MTMISSTSSPATGGSPATHVITDATSVTLATLAAGTAIAGKVGIDQTTPGTTNGVQVNAALPAGTAIIGKVGIDQTTPGTTNGVQVNAALPAGTNLLGGIAASAETSIVYNGTAVLTPLFATIGTSSSGATTIIAAVSSKKIRVLALQLVANAAVNAKWQSHVTPTDLTGLAYLAANGGYVLPFNPVGWFQTISGEALDLNLSGSIAVGGSITYVTV